jgi:hypothetical protein
VLVVTPVRWEVVFMNFRRRERSIAWRKWGELVRIRAGAFCRGI